MLDRVIKAINAVPLRVYSLNVRTSLITLRQGTSLHTVLFRGIAYYINSHAQMRAMLTYILKQAKHTHRKLRCFHLLNQKHRCQQMSFSHIHTTTLPTANSNECKNAEY